MATRTFKIKIDGRTFEAEVEEIGGSAPAAAAPRPAAAAPTSVPQPAASAGGGSAVTAPMPGKILAVKVSRGQQIKAGDVVIILEAMKMEQEIPSAFSGSVSDILVAAGDTVRKEQALIVVG